MAVNKCKCRAKSR